MLPWKPEFQSYQHQNLMQLFLSSDNVSHEILSRLAIWYKRYTHLKLWTDDNGRRRTTEHWHINSSLEPLAQVS